MKENLKNLNYMKFINLVLQFANLKCQLFDAKSKGNCELHTMEDSSIDVFSSICEIASRIDYDALNKSFSETK